MNRAIVRVALALAAAGVPLLTNGCSAAPSGGEKASASSDALGANVCADQPFTELTQHFRCTPPIDPPGGGSGGGRQIESCFRTAECDAVCAPAAYAPGSPYSKRDSLTCFATGALVLAPPGPSGCTTGVVLRPNEPGLDHLADGTVSVDMWACKAGTPRPPISVDGVTMCAVDPLDGFASIPFMPAGQTRCAWFYEGPDLYSDGEPAGTDCVGNASDGWTLLQERVFVGVKRGGIIQNGCAGGCTLPEAPP